MPDDRASRPAHYWFSEGFTDYYARALMVRAGVISTTEFVAQWNEMLAAYAGSPARTMSGKQAAAAFWEDPHTTPPAEYRMDLCVGTDRPIEAHGERIEACTIPGGRCAVLRVIGNTDNLEPAALYLYRDWLPASGEEARDFPLYCQRVTFFPEVPEHEAIADLFLPLK